MQNISKSCMMKKTILYVDDIKTNLFTLESVIENLAGDLYDVVTANSAMEGLGILLKQKIDIILLDVMMPEINGFEAAKMIKSNKKTKNIPIIFLTAKKDDETIENCYNFGGNDYVSKPFNHVELLARISFHIRLSDKELEVKMREKELKHEASYDSLTNIYNRKMFNRLVIEKITKAKVEKKSFIFIIMDIDYFKKVNDYHGHLVGDEVLKSIVKVVKSHIRDTDIFARWGGEEFVLVLDVDMKKGLEITENLRHHIELEELDVVKTVTCSFGVTEFRDKDSIDDMIKRADNALYRAKDNGRNQVCQD